MSAGIESWSGTPSRPKHKHEISLTSEKKNSKKLPKKGKYLKYSHMKKHEEEEENVKKITKKGKPKSDYEITKSKGNF